MQYHRSTLGTIGNSEPDRNQSMTLPLPGPLAAQPLTTYPGKGEAVANRPLEPDWQTPYLFLDKQTTDTSARANISIIPRSHWPRRLFLIAITSSRDTCQMPSTALDKEAASETPSADCA